MKQIRLDERLTLVDSGRDLFRVFQTQLFNDAIVLALITNAMDL